MKQILQNLGSGETILADVPEPGIVDGNLLIHSENSLISIGTEKMLIDFGKAGWIDKARNQPDKVKMVIQKIKTDGLFATYRAVSAKLDQPIALGYANAGVVLESKDMFGRFNVGDRVVSNGPHAQCVSVPVNLCALIPDEVTFEEASFTVIGAIGLQGIRLLKPTLGESIAVMGLGLIGLLCVQMLKAQGCKVLGIDFDSSKCELARQFGAEAVDLSKGEDPVEAGMAFTQGFGIDGVLITASTNSNDPVHHAANMCRKRGRIVLVGVVGLQLSRADFYEKELSFQVSCSYGPGRYDSNYELKGQDYPIGFVRWTEQRNFEAFLQLLAEGLVNVKPLISSRFAFVEALKAYEKLGSGNALGILLNYEPQNTPQLSNKVREGRPSSVNLRNISYKKGSSVCIGYIGAGGFSSQVLLPALKKTSARLKSIVSLKGVTGTHLGRKFAFEQSSTDSNTLLEDKEINTIIITTRHNSHALYVKQALQAGKKVYVEKPLCLTSEELSTIQQIFFSQRDLGKNPFLMVGFNRRFAPQIVKMKSLLADINEPKSMVMMINSGKIPADHWIQDSNLGGGRIIGEGCHFIDLLRFIVGVPIVSVRSSVCEKLAANGCKDTVTVSIEFEDGSIGSVHYFSNGNKSYPKERLEVFCGGRILQLDNFRRLVGHGFKRFNKMNLWSQDKGHCAEMDTLVKAITYNEPSPIPFEEIVEVTRASFVAAGLYPKGL